MKKHFTNYILRMCFAMFALCLGFTAQAQTGDPEIGIRQPVVLDTHLSDDFSITLNNTLPVSETYTVDVTHYSYNMPDQPTADVFIDQYDKQYVDVEVDQAKLTATISLEFTVETENWTVEEWNEYLKN